MKLNSPKNKINQYVCDTCKETMTTTHHPDALEGTTSMMVSCKVTKGCTGTMVSRIYQVPQDLPPTFEWYKPKNLPKNSGLRQHVEMGGLMLRRLPLT